MTVWSVLVFILYKTEIKGGHMAGTTKENRAGTALPKPLDDITVLDMTIALAVRNILARRARRSRH